MSSVSVPETPLAQAERHVREGEARVARQREIVAEMEKDNHPYAAEMARTLLDTLLRTLELEKQHLEIERAKNQRR